MSHQFSGLIMNDPNMGEVYTPEFNTPQQQYVMKSNDIMQPVPAIVTKQESLLTQNKECILGGKILRMTCGSDFGLGMNNFINVGSFDSYGGLQCSHQETLADEETFPSNNGIEVSLEAPEDETYQSELTVNAPDASIKGYEGNTDPLCHDDPDMAAAIEYINSSGSSKSLEFVPLPSTKKRNPPYLIKGDSKIATKNGEPVKFRLRGAKVCQVLKISMRFSEEKFKNTPVYACPLHNSEGKCNFDVSVKGLGQCQYDDILGHYTALLPLVTENFDVAENFDFHVTFKCLNSCHKENGKKMELLLTLIDNDGTLLKEDYFEIRACKNVKRDYKEAFQDDDLVIGKKLRPDAFIAGDCPQPSSSGSEEVKPVKIKGKTVKVQMLQPVGDAKNIKKEYQHGKAVKCVQAPASEIFFQKFYLVRLPDATKEKLTLGMIKELGGEILSLDSVVPAEINEEDCDEAA